MAKEQIKEVLEEGRESMQKAIDALKRDLGRVRTGRASLSLLDGIKVDYYGVPTPLNEVASLSVPESRMIVIQPWDAKMLGEIDKAINKSDLGINPTNDGKLIRLVMPRPTEERRLELVKVVKKKGEVSKVAVRACRRDCIDMLQVMEKDKVITEDENKKGQDEVQKLTNEFVGNIDRIIELKEQEVMEI